MIVKFFCDYCKKPRERRVRGLAEFNRTQRHYCNNKCQNANDRLRGIDKTLKAHQTIREKGHYKRDNSYMIGENNWMWKGDKASYNAIHNWIYRQLGKPQKCSKNSRHIAPFFWANKSGEYKRDISDWWSLCNSCNQTDGIPIHSRFK